MPVKSEETFHQRARRDQLVGLAVEIIGEDGLAALSISEVARRAGTSRGVVGYNVGTLEDLLRLVVARAYDAGREAVRPAVEAAGDPVAALQAFVAASLDFYAARPHEMRALREVFADRRATSRSASEEHRREVDGVVDLLRAGQEQGLVVEADVDLLASVVRAALDVAARRIARGEDDARLREELAALVDRLVGAGPAR